MQKGGQVGGAGGSGVGSRRESFISDVDWMDQNLSKGYGYDAGAMADKFDALVRNLGTSQSSDYTDNLASIRIVSLKLLGRILGENPTDFDGFEHLQPHFLQQHINHLQRHKISIPHAYDWCSSSQPGGWLRYLVNRDVAEGSSNRNGSRSSSGGGNISSIGQDSIIKQDAAKLLKLLQPGSDLMIMFERDFSRQGRFELKLSKFPPKFKWLLRHTCQSTMDFYDCVRTPNQIVYSHYLTCGTRLAGSGGQTGKITGGVGSVGLGAGGGGMGVGSNGDVSAEKVWLHPVEYFMFSLLNYPSSGSSADDIFQVNTRSSSYEHAPGAGMPRPPELINLTAVSLMQIRGAMHWLHGNPYLVLLNQYIAEFSYNAEHAPGKNYGAAVFPNGAQIFIRLAIEIWLENTSVIKRDFGNEAIYRAMLNENQYMVDRERVKSKQSRQATPHPLPDEVKLLNEEGWRCPFPSLQSFHLLLLHMLNRPNLDKEFQTFAQTPYASARSFGGARSAGHSQPNREVELMACPMPLNIVQLPLFDTLRVIFTRYDHRSNCATFALAVETWLLYIQPWKVGPHMLKLHSSSTSSSSSAAGGGGGGVGGGGRGGVFQTSWKTYVACNLHFYTTIFVCFLKAMSNAQFDGSEEGKMHFFLLNRAFDVLNEKGLKKVVNDFSTYYSCYPFPNALTNGTPAPSSSGSGWMGGGEGVSEFDLLMMRNQHRVLFPDVSIDSIKLPGCSAGIIIPQKYKNALHSAGKIIYSLEQLSAQQRSKSVLGGGGDIFNVLLGGTVSVQGRLLDGAPNPDALKNAIGAICKMMRENDKESEEDIKSCLKATLESSDLGSEVGTKKLIARGAFGILERDMRGNLSLSSKKQLLGGKVKCDVSEGSIAFLDPLGRDTPIRSYEVAPMARIFIELSVRLNQHMGLPLKPGAEVGSFKRLVRKWVNELVEPETEAKLHSLCARFPLMGPLPCVIYLILNKPREVGIKINDCFRFNLRPFASYYSIIPSVLIGLYFYQKPNHSLACFRILHDICLYTLYLYESILMGFTNLSSVTTVELNLYLLLYLLVVCNFLAPTIFYIISALIVSLRLFPDKRQSVSDTLQRGLSG